MPAAAAVALAWEGMAQVALATVTVEDVTAWVMVTMAVVAMALGGTAHIQSKLAVQSNPYLHQLHKDHDCNHWVHTLSSNQSRHSKLNDRQYTWVVERRDRVAMVRVRVTAAAMVNGAGETRANAAKEEILAAMIGVEAIRVLVVSQRVMGPLVLGVAAKAEKPAMAGVKWEATNRTQDPEKGQLYARPLP